MFIEKNIKVFQPAICEKALLWRMGENKSLNAAFFLLSFFQFVFADLLLAA